MRFLIAYLMLVTIGFAGTPVDGIRITGSSSLSGTMTMQLNSVLNGTGASGGTINVHSISLDGTNVIALTGTSAGTHYVSGTGLSLSGSTFNNTGVLSIAGSNSILGIATTDGISTLTISTGTAGAPATIPLLSSLGNIILSESTRYGGGMLVWTNSNGNVGPAGIYWDQFHGGTDVNGNNGELHIQSGQSIYLGPSDSTQSSFHIQLGPASGAGGNAYAYLARDGTTGAAVTSVKSQELIFNTAYYIGGTNFTSSGVAISATTTTANDVTLLINAPTRGGFLANSISMKLYGALTANAITSGTMSIGSAGSAMNYVVTGSSSLVLPVISALGTGTVYMSVPTSAVTTNNPDVNVTFYGALPNGALPQRWYVVSTGTVAIEFMNVLALNPTTGGTISVRATVTGFNTGL